MKKIIFLFVLMLSTIMTGCYGGRMLLTAKQSRYAVSTSPVVYTSDGRVLLQEDQLLVKHFKRSYSRWNILWSLINFSSYEKDLSEDLSRVVERVGGCAVVNLAVKSTFHPWTGLLSPFAFWLPFVPTAHLVVVEGDIIQPKDDSIEIYYVSE